VTEPDNKDPGASHSNDEVRDAKHARADSPDAPPAAADGGDGQGQQGGQGGENRPQGNRPQGRRDRNRRDRNRGGGGGGGERGGQQRFQPPQDEEYDESKNGGGDGPLIDLNELKRKPAHQLLVLADELGIQEGVARARKQDIIFLILKAHARAGGNISAEGVL